MSTTAIAPVAAGTFAIDRTHSEVLFRVRHLMSRVTGHFRDFSGTITYDPANLGASKVEFAIKSASIDTNVADRDTHLRSADFFDVEKFPELTFVSSQVVAAGVDGFTVTGTLTIRDVAQQIDLPVTFLGAAKDPWGNEKVAFEASIRLNRKEFGLTWNAALETGGFLVGEDVDVSLNVQAARV
jgi:polyisoprenoid-binding protein YceI